MPLIFAEGLNVAKRYVAVVYSGETRKWHRYVSQQCTLYRQVYDAKATLTFSINRTCITFSPISKLVPRSISLACL